MNVIQKKSLPTRHGEHIIALPVDAEILCIETVSSKKDFVGVFIRTNSEQVGIIQRCFFVAVVGYQVPSIEETEFLGQSLLENGTQILIFVAKDNNKLFNKLTPAEKLKSLASQ